METRIARAAALWVILMPAPLGAQTVNAEPVVPGIGLIGLDHELFVQEFSGRWARVQVREPAWTCAGPEEEFDGTVRQGWVRWWGEDRGPWVWFPTRGC